MILSQILTEMDVTMNRLIFFCTYPDVTLVCLLSLPLYMTKVSPNTRNYGCPIIR